MAETPIGFLLASPAQTPKGHKPFPLAKSTISNDRFPFIPGDIKIRLISANGRLRCFFGVPFDRRVFGTASPGPGPGPLSERSLDEGRALGCSVGSRSMARHHGLAGHRVGHLREKPKGPKYTGKVVQKKLLGCWAAFAGLLGCWLRTEPQKWSKLVCHI